VPPVETSALLTFVAIAALVLVTPGPSLLLIASASFEGGRRAGLVAVAGTALGLALVVAIVVFGLGAIAPRLAAWTGWLRWLGVAGLVVQGLRELRPRVRAGIGPPVVPGFWTAFGISALNPSTTPFLVALLPQFLVAGRPAVPQLVVLGGTFLALAAGIDTLCARAAARLGSTWAGRGRVTLRRRISGGLLLAAAALLAVAGRP